MIGSCWSPGPDKHDLLPRVCYLGITRATQASKELQRSLVDALKVTPGRETDAQTTGWVAQPAPGLTPSHHRQRLPRRADRAQLGALQVLREPPGHKLWEVAGDQPLGQPHAGSPAVRMGSQSGRLKGRHAASDERPDDPESTSPVPAVAEREGSPKQP